jgi:hypothetical protein
LGGSDIGYSIPELEDEAGVKFQLLIIEPDGTKIGINSEDNFYSLGSAIKISYQHKGKTYYWTYLTLGDMEPDVAQSRLVGLMGDTAIIPAESEVALKISHHASSHNYMPELMEKIETTRSKKNLRMISSGFTYGDFSKYSEKLQEGKWSFCFLFDEEIKRSQAGGDIRAFLEGGAQTLRDITQTLRDIIGSNPKLNFGVFDHLICCFNIDKEALPTWQFDGEVSMFEAKPQERKRKDRAKPSAEEEASNEESDEVESSDGEEVSTEADAVDATTNNDDDDDDTSDGKQPVRPTRKSRKT